MLLLIGACVASAAIVLPEPPVGRGGRPGPNLIVNPDFEQGATAFTTQYLFQGHDDLGPGAYFVGASPSAWNEGLANCPDDTQPPGTQMMIVDGKAGLTVWSQTVPVLRGRYYRFAFRYLNLDPRHPAVLSAGLTGNAGLFLSFQVNLTNGIDCAWNLGETGWYNVDNTLVTITITDLVGDPDGNDFAIDDLELRSIRPPAQSFAGGVLEAPVATPELQLSVPRPNPSRGPVDLAYSLAQTGPVEVAVFDVEGREVAEPDRGVREAGWHVAVWNGHWESGRRAEAGLYFVRLRADGRELLERLVRLE